MALRDFAPLSAVTAGLVTVLVSVTSTAAIVFSAARAAGAGDAELSSWMLALCVGTGITCIGLSLRYRSPIVTAWSTPGAALLVTALPGFTMREAVGAFLVSALLITVTGLTGWFGRIMDRVPVPLASALLAGVLLQFGIGLFASANTDAPLILAMFATYLVFRRFLPRYAVLAALTVGVTVAAVTGSFRPGQVRLTLAEPVFTVPAFSWQAVIGVAVPLFVVTMASQNLPGVAVLRNDGYQVPVSPLITWTGAVNLVLAPLGVFGLNLAAITAAICTGPQAHPDPRRRYLASVWAGGFYLVVGVFGATITSLLAALPTVLVLGIAGIGLLATIGSSLTTGVLDPRWREAAVVTFLTAASGVQLLGIGAAFWALLAGLLTAWATTPAAASHSATPAAVGHGATPAAAGHSATPAAAGHGAAATAAGYGAAATPVGHGAIAAAGHGAAATAAARAATTPTAGHGPAATPAVAADPTPTPADHTPSP